MDSAQSPDDGTTPVKRSPGRPRKDATTDQVDRKETPTRVAFGGRRLRLSVIGKDPGYHYGWFRDQGDNYVLLRQAGYQEVSFREAHREVPELLENTDDRLRPEDTCRTHGGTGEGGVPYKMILLKQPMSFFKEDQATQEKRNAEIDTAITRPELEGGKIVGSQYIPDAGINLSIKDKE